MSQCLCQRPEKQTGRGRFVKIQKRRKAQYETLGPEIELCLIGQYIVSHSFSKCSDPMASV